MNNLLLLCSGDRASPAAAKGGGIGEDNCRAGSNILDFWVIPIKLVEDAHWCKTA
jgi:hypothetical protein